MNSENTSMGANSRDHLSNSATLNRDGQGRPIGAVLFVSAEQLFEAGIDLEGVDSIDIFPSGGSLRVSSSEVNE